MPAKETAPGRVQVIFTCRPCGNTFRYTGLASHAPTSHQCPDCHNPMHQQ